MVVAVTSCMPGASGPSVVQCAMPMVPASTGAVQSSWPLVSWTATEPSVTPFVSRLKTTCCSLPMLTDPEESGVKVSPS
ncbi:hypothetical protein ASG04_03385 [Curtobacterium sp. Leaf183]|nr:hypothetical protein ASG04_03385 [Curtobacterium sp. Leaf183]